MGHPNIENKTPFAFETLFLADEELRPLVVAVIKGTFTIVPDAPCEHADEQIPVDVSARLADRYCALHADVVRRVYPGASHDGVLDAAHDDAVAWLNGILAGTTADLCTGPTLSSTTISRVPTRGA